MGPACFVFTKVTELTLCGEVTLLCGNPLKKAWKPVRPPTQIYYLVMQLLHRALVCLLLRWLSGSNKRPGRGRSSKNGNQNHSTGALHNIYISFCYIYMPQTFYTLISFYRSSNESGWFVSSKLVRLCSLLLTFYSHSLFFSPGAL